MTAVGKFPCDEAAILTRGDRTARRPGPLGAGGHDSRIEPGVHRQHGRERGSSGPAVCARRDAGGRAVGGRSLRAHAGRAAPDRRIAGRSSGRRKVFAAASSLFAAASAWCGLSRTIGELIAARAVQGVGAALLVPGSLALISASFPPASAVARSARGRGSPRSRPRSGRCSAAGSSSTCRGAGSSSSICRSPLVVLAITIWRVPETRAAHAADRLDWPGVVLTTAGLGALSSR